MGGGGAPVGTHEPPATWGACGPLMSPSSQAQFQHLFPEMQEAEPPHLSSQHQTAFTLHGVWGPHSDPRPCPLAAPPLLSVKGLCDFTPNSN